MPWLWNMRSELLAMLACCWLCTSCHKPEPPQFDTRTPDSIDVLVAEKQLGTVTNATALMALLRRGEFVPPHPCAARGELILRYRAGDEVRVSLYSGHSDSRFEFAVGGRGYSVDRRRFMETLKAAGIELGRLLQ